MLFRTVLLLCCLVGPLAGAQGVTVGAAVSLKETMEQIAQTYRDQTGERIVFSFGSSGQIMGQIRGGAPIDVFISASDVQMDRLVEEGLVDVTSRRVVATNQLVLVVPVRSERTPQTLSDLLDTQYKRIALGEPKAVPAGQYAAQALRSAGMLEALCRRIVHGSNVRQVLSYVARSEVDAGIVYRTDALAAADRVTLAATVPEELHEPIIYSAAVVAGAREREAAARFLDYLSTPAARQILRDCGFGLPVLTPATAPATAPTP